MSGVLPAGPFALCLMDPPWAFRTFSGKNRTPTQKKFREAEDHYPTMTVPKIEMFARNTRPGWESWGNEVGKFDARG
jgi:N6-adenosine-specific RNA methylase IME4